MQKTLKQRMADNNYVHFENTFNEYDNKYKLTKSEFKLIINTFFYILADEMLHKGKWFNFPRALGTFGITKFKNKNLLPDFKHFNLTGELRKIRNLHSEGFVAQLRWDKYRLRRVDPMACLFKLQPARGFARTLAQLIKKDNAISIYYDE